MRSFKDKLGRTWDLTINYVLVKRVRSLLSLDLLSLIQDQMKGMSELLADPIQQIDLLYVLCREQADARKVSDEDFGRAFDAETLVPAIKEFVEEYIDFFLQPAQRPLLRRAMELSWQLGEMTAKKASEELEKVDLNLLLDKLTDSSGSAPGSSASTPENTPSANSTGWPRVEGETSGTG